MDTNTRNALNTVAGKIGVDPSWLEALIMFESNWNPVIRAGMPYNQATINKVPGTTPKYARGLIQFIDTSAQDAGYKDSLDLVTKHPDAASQLLGPVYNYFRKKGPFPTKQSLYMAVLYPVARDWPSTQLFPSNVRASNPGINTPQDYVNFVDRKAKLKGIMLTAEKGASIVGVLFLLGGLYMLRRYL